MTNLERRLRKLESHMAGGEEIVIEIEYAFEPPKSPIGELEERPGLRPSLYRPRPTIVYLSEDDLRL